MSECQARVSKPMLRGFIQPCFVQPRPAFCRWFPRLSLVCCSYLFLCALDTLTSVCQSQLSNQHQVARRHVPSQRGEPFHQRDCDLHWGRGSVHIACSITEVSGQLYPLLSAASSPQFNRFASSRAEQRTGLSGQRAFVVLRPL